MSTTLSTDAGEQSTYKITAAFADAAGAAVIPNSITWTLTDLDGTVINSREDVSVAVPAASVDILLSGDDLQITSTRDSGKRVLTVYAVYDSDEGNNLPLRGEARFQIEDLINVG